MKKFKVVVLLTKIDILDDKLQKFDFGVCVPEYKGNFPFLFNSNVSTGHPSMKPLDFIVMHIQSSLKLSTGSVLPINLLEISEVRKLLKLPLL